MTKICKHPKSYECVYCMFSKLGVPDKDLRKIAAGFYKENKKSYSGHGCDRCRKPDEPYMLHDSVWGAVTDNTHENFLCLACVEIRLGNTLKLKHFTDSPMNYGIFMFDAREYIKNKRKLARKVKEDTHRPDCYSCECPDGFEEPHGSGCLECFCEPKKSNKF